MIRKIISPRPDWKEKVEKLGFAYHTLDGVRYWDESVVYEFNHEQVQKLEDATDELYNLCLKAVDHVVRTGLFELFSIPDQFIPLVRDSWEKRETSVYGRFDLSWDGNLNLPPKMLEFNADTPTSLFEGGAVQWFWLHDLMPEADQFNSIHEKLIDTWKKEEGNFNSSPLYFTCLHQYPEDLINVTYLQDCAEQAGIRTKFINLNQIGFDGASFLDLDNQPIHRIFKLYPWEWMMREQFAGALLMDKAKWIEPSWKTILSNKAILAVLWELFPGHPNLLECYFDDPHTMKSYAIKPLLSREGANVTLVENEKVVIETLGEYGEEGYIYQQLHKLPDFSGFHPVIGSWVIGGEAAGIGIREASSLVTDNFSRFVPHWVLD